MFTIDFTAMFGKKKVTGIREIIDKKDFVPTADKFVSKSVVSHAVAMYVFKLEG